MSQSFFHADSQSDYIENIIKSLAQNIVVLDVNQQVVVWNPHMEEQFLSEKEAIGKPLQSIFPRFWEEYRGKIWGEILENEVIGKGNTRELLRFPLRTRNNKIRYFDVKGTPLRNNKGEIIGAILAMSDITDKIYLENQLFRNAKTTSLANLGASIAHEIRNPLNSISLNIQLIKDGLEHPQDYSREEMVDMLASVLAEIRNLDEIIRSFLGFSRPPVPKLLPKDPNLSVKQALCLLAEQARQARVKIIENLGNLPRALIDQNQLSQAVYNICLNAIQEMQAQKYGTLEVRTMANKDYILIEIKDDGPGLSHEAQEKLFDLFYTTKEEGTGLGLPIANQIVEKHEGRIVAENNLDRGACFSIYLPVAPPVNGTV